MPLFSCCRVAPSDDDTDVSPVRSPIATTMNNVRSIVSPKASQHREEVCSFPQHGVSGASNSCTDALSVECERSKGIPTRMIDALSKPPLSPPNVELSDRSRPTQRKGIDNASPKVIVTLHCSFEAPPSATTGGGNTVSESQSRELVEFPLHSIIEPIQRFLERLDSWKKIASGATTQSRGTHEDVGPSMSIEAIADEFRLSAEHFITSVERTVLTASDRRRNDDHQEIQREESSSDVNCGGAGGSGDSGARLRGNTEINKRKLFPSRRGTISSLVVPPDEMESPPLETISPSGRSPQGAAVSILPHVVDIPSCQGGTFREPRRMSHNNNNIASHSREDSSGGMATFSKHNAASSSSASAVFSTQQPVSNPLATSGLMPNPRDQHDRTQTYGTEAQSLTSTSLLSYCAMDSLEEDPKPMNFTLAVPHGSQAPTATAAAGGSGTRVAPPAGRQSMASTGPLLNFFGVGQSFASNRRVVSSYHNNAAKGSHTHSRNLLESSSNQDFAAQSMLMESVVMTNQALRGTDDVGTKMLNDYLLLQNIGRGASGKVKLAFQPSKNRLVAVKIIRRDRGGGALGRKGDGQREALDQEIAVMKKLRHKNIVSLYEVIDDPEAEKLYLVMQYVDEGPLATVIAGSEAGSEAGDGASVMYGPSLAVETVVDFVRQICSGLEYLHQRGIAHRDIKPENILKSSNQQVFLADFGVSEMEGASLPQRLCGTPLFMAPELAKLTGGAMDDDAQELTIDPKALDMWALGVTMVALVTGRLPFNSTRELQSLMKNQDVTDAVDRCVSASSNPPLNPIIRDVIISLMDLNPAKRPSANIVKKMLKL